MSSELCRLCHNRTRDRRHVIGEQNEWVWVCTSCAEIYVAKVNGEERIIELIK